MYFNSSPFRHGWVFFWLLWLSVLILKTLHLWQIASKPSLWIYVNGIAPEMLLASINLIVYIIIHRRCRTWCVLPFKVGLGAFALLMLVATLSSFYIFFVTGQLPRIQQLQGLNWDLMGASITPMVLGIKWQIIGAVLALITLLWFLEKYLSRLLDKHYLGFFSLTLFAPLLILTLNQCADNDKNCIPNEGLLAYSLLEYDIDDMDEATAAQVEQDFFNDYRKKLAATSGLHPDYAAIYPQLKNKNIILFVMESVRHKELPMHGGTAHMPFLQSLKEQGQMIVFDHMYSQDIRSTKAYAALDMGMFSLLSWDSYSNHLTHQFTDNSLPERLKQQGYASYSYTSGSANYDRHQEFQIYRGYDETVYVDWNDNLLLERMDKRFATVDKPFYMQVWPMATHHPYTREFWLNRDQWIKEHPEGIKHGQPEDFARYLQGLTDTDDFFKQMVEQLKRHGLYEDTVILAVGDHGEAFGEHNSGNVFHGNNIYEQSIHVGAFLHSPLLKQSVHEQRFFSHKDLIASIWQLASTKEQAVFNDARSVFNQYEYEMPIYLYNSWSKYVGLIWQGHKLRYRDKPHAPMYFASIADIENDLKHEEVTVDKSNSHIAHEKELKRWEKALKALTYQRLYAHKQRIKQGGFEDVLRLYCDDGQGFREGLQDKIILSKRLDNRLFLHPDKNCQALRLVFLQKYPFSDKKDMIAFIKQLEVKTETQTLQLNDLNIVSFVALEQLDLQHFKLSKNAYIDFQLAKQTVNVQKISLQLDFLESYKPR